mmetsp:Transcript_75373/g.147941  ORF Transcript_75373/g.147941 Transcript_75373/m.147941 type:complete len:234 (-) Transcript_75373:1992-2693(-)
MRVSSRKICINHVVSSVVVPIAFILIRSPCIVEAPSFPVAWIFMSIALVVSGSVVIVAVSSGALLSFPILGISSSDIFLIVPPSFMASSIVKSSVVSMSLGVIPRCPPLRRDPSIIARIRRTPTFQSFLLISISRSHATCFTPGTYLVVAWHRCWWLFVSSLSDKCSSGTFTRFGRPKPCTHSLGDIGKFVGCSLLFLEPNVTRHVKIDLPSIFLNLLNEFRFINMNSAFVWL